MPVLPRSIPATSLPVITPSRPHDSGVMTPVSSIALWSAHDIACQGGRSVGDVAVVAVAGVAGSGKSTLGRALATALGLPLLDLDAVTNPLLDRLVGQVLPTHWLAAPHGELIREGRYAALRAVAGDVVATAGGAVLVAPFTAELAGGAAWDGWSRRSPPPRSIWCTSTAIPRCSPPAVRRGGRHATPSPRRRCGRPAVGHRRRTPVRRRTAPRPASPSRGRIARRRPPPRRRDRKRCVARGAAHRARRGAHARAAARHGRCARSATGRRSTRATRSSGSGSTPCCSTWTACSSTRRPRSPGPGTGGRRSTSVSAQALQENHGQPAQALVERLVGPERGSRRASPGSRRSRSTTRLGSRAVPRRPGPLREPARTPAGRRHLGHAADRHGAACRTAGFSVPGTLVTADDVPRGKPDPAPYLLAAQSGGGCRPGGAWPWRTPRRASRRPARRAARCSR